MSRKNRACPRAVTVAAVLVLALGVDGAPSPRLVAAGEIQPSIARQAAQIRALGGTGHRSTAALASSVAAPVLEDGRLVCWITPSAAAPDLWSPSLPGVEVQGATAGAIQAAVAPQALHDLAALPEVLHVGVPPVGIPLVRSEGLTPMEVPEFWTETGVRGAGVRVGIIDVGFARYGSRLGTELPANVHARSFYLNSAGQGDISGGGQDHGTACAEIVHDVAPDAEMYISNVATPADLERAIDWMVEEGVEVISHSVGWFVGAGDGTGAVQDLALRARRAGVVWVNAVGNFGQAHWTGLWNDADADGILDVDGPEGERLHLPAVEAGRELLFVLMWDRWPTSADLEFEIDLMQGETISASSIYDFAGYPYAYRAIAISRSAAMPEPTLRVRLTEGNPQGVRLRVLRGDSGVFSPESRVPEGSVIAPADAAELLSVGAFDWSTGTLEPFSSRGPTAVGVMKPDLLGPDGVTTSVDSDFTGTSAACPHVAGACALLLSSSIHGGLFDLRWSVPEVLAMLEHAADPVAEAPAGATGWGRVRMPRDLAAPAGPRLLALGYGEGGGPRLRLERSPEGAVPRVLVFDVRGRRVGELEGSRPGIGPGIGGGPGGGVPAGQSAGYGSGTEVGIGAWEFRPGTAAVALARGRYWALEPRTGARASFFWPGGR